MGGQRFAFDEDAAIFLPEPQRDQLLETLRRFYIQEEAQANFMFSDRGIAGPPKPTTYLSGSWVSLLSPNSGNWMHWLCECLPSALPIVESNDSERDVGILVDAGIPAQAMESLKLVAQNRKIVRVAWGQAIQVERLESTSHSWSAFWPRGDGAYPGRFQFDGYRLIALRNLVLSMIPTQGSTEFEAVLDRGQGLRQSVNFDVARNDLVAMGFSVLTPQALSFEKQVKIFHSLRTVVGQAGAGFANIMFMRPGARAVLFYADTPYSSQKYFVDYGDAFGVQVIAIPGRPVPPASVSARGRKAPFSSAHPLNAGVIVPRDEILKAVKQPAGG